MEKRHQRYICEREKKEKKGTLLPNVRIWMNVNWSTERQRKQANGLIVPYLSIIKYLGKKKKYIKVYINRKIQGIMLTSCNLIQLRGVLVTTVDYGGGSGGGIFYFYHLYIRQARLKFSHRAPVT